MYGRGDEYHKKGNSHIRQSQKDYPDEQEHMNSQQHYRKVPKSTTQSEKDRLMGYNTPYLSKDSSYDQDAKRKLEERKRKKAQKARDQKRLKDSWKNKRDPNYLAIPSIESLFEDKLEETLMLLDLNLLPGQSDQKSKALTRDRTIYEQQLMKRQYAFRIKKHIFMKNEYSRQFECYEMMHSFSYDMQQQQYDYYDRRDYHYSRYQFSKPQNFRQFKSKMIQQILKLDGGGDPLTYKISINYVVGVLMKRFRQEFDKLERLAKQNAHILATRFGRIPLSTLLSLDLTLTQIRKQMVQQTGFKSPLQQHKFNLIRNCYLYREAKQRSIKKYFDYLKEQLTTRKQMKKQKKMKIYPAKVKQRQNEKAQLGAKMKNKIQHVPNLQSKNSLQPPREFHTTHSAELNLENNSQERRSSLTKNLSFQHEKSRQQSAIYSNINHSTGQISEIKAESYIMRPKTESENPPLASKGYLANNIYHSGKSGSILRSDQAKHSNFEPRDLPQDTKYQRQNSHQRDVDQFSRVGSEYQPDKETVQHNEMMHSKGRNINYGQQQYQEEESRHNTYQIEQYSSDQQWTQEELILKVRLKYERLQVLMSIPSIQLLMRPFIKKLIPTNDWLKKMNTRQESNNQTLKKMGFKESSPYWVRIYQLLKNWKKIVFIEDNDKLDKSLEIRNYCRKSSSKQEIIARLKDIDGYFIKPQKKTKMRNAQQTQILYADKSVMGTLKQGCTVDPEMLKAIANYLAESKAVDTENYLPKDLTISPGLNSTESQRGQNIPKKRPMLLLMPWQCDLLLEKVNLEQQPFPNQLLTKHFQRIILLIVRVHNYTNNEAPTETESGIMILDVEAQKLIIYSSVEHPTIDYSKYQNALNTRFHLQQRKYNLVQPYRFEIAEGRSMLFYPKEDNCICTIICLLMFVDGKVQKYPVYQIYFQSDILANLRRSLYPLMVYFSYCYAQKRVVRRDYFDFLVRDFIYRPEIKSWTTQNSIQIF